MSVRTVRSVRRVRTAAATGTVAALFGLVTACSSGGAPHPAAAAAAPGGSAQIGHLSVGQDPAAIPTPGASASATASATDGGKPASGNETTGGTPAGKSSTTHPTVKNPGPVAHVAVPAGWSHKGIDQGSLPGGTSLQVTFALAGRDPSGLKAFTAAVSDPASSQYRHFLSNADYAARFGPDPAVRDALASYLSSAGLKVATKAQDYVSVAGSATQVETALKVALHNFKVGSDTRFAPTGAISLPASLSSAVLEVSGLDNTPTTAHPASVGTPAPANGNTTIGRPGCSNGYGFDSGQPHVGGATVDYSPCAYDFQTIRQGYGVPATGLDGRGVTVGIIDIYNPSTLFNDASTYARTHGWPGYAPLQFTDVTDPNGYYPLCGDPQGWYEEAAMDVQSVHAMAPAANVMYGAVACDQHGGAYLYTMMDYMISNHLVDIMSDSWNLGLEDQVDPQDVKAFDLMFQQAIAKGIGVYFASGDCGDSNNDCTARIMPPGFTKHVAVWYPASSPYVTSVGGTALAVDNTGHRLFNAPWADVPVGQGFGDGSGGGTSTLYAAPTVATNGYQQPGGAAHRMIPDIALDAAPDTGMVFGMHQDGAGNPNTGGTYGETTAGGTSLATPLLAGIQALVQQRAGSALGFANPRLYQLAGTTAIEDVVLNAQPGTSGSTPMTFGYPLGSSFPELQEIPSGAIACGANANAANCAGYDTVTGLGTLGSSYIADY